MPEISVYEGHGSIYINTPENKLTRHVEDPGDDYMKAAYEVMKAICESLANNATMPKVEDVAHHLKDLLPVAAPGLEPRRPRL